MEADRWIERVVYQRDHLPEAQRLAEVETTLRQMAGELKTAEAALAPLEAAFTQAEAEAARLAERVNVLDRRLNADGVPAKELATIQTEIEHVSDLRSQAEDREVEALLDGCVTIPMAGRAESLNVAVAGSVLLFEAARQRTEGER